MIDDVDSLSDGSTQEKTTTISKDGNDVIIDKTWTERQSSAEKSIIRRTSIPAHPLGNRQRRANHTPHPDNSDVSD
ncbi:hypothetical protein RB195_013150 [Necator americanus]|uniref:Uncharacterized protein n=1 Tax=Necator americanus TaxID=51031 RepID=A0ABR1DU74_NECAM